MTVPSLCAYTTAMFACTPVVATSKNGDHRVNTMMHVLISLDGGVHVAACPVFFCLQTRPNATVPQYAPKATLAGHMCIGWCEH